MRAFLDKIMEIFSTALSAIIFQHQFCNQEVANFTQLKVFHIVSRERNFKTKFIVFVVKLRSTGSSRCSKARLNTKCSMFNRKHFSVIKR